MTPLVAADQLGFTGRLHRTTLRIEPGRLVCLVGPNGSGKTSLLHALARVGGPAGQVRIGGVDPDRLGPDARQRLIGFLPAAREPRWPLKARDLIALGLPAGATIDQATAALELDPLLDRTMDRLSTGERSRVLIARALAAGPRLLLLDEPTANLDPLWQLKLMHLLLGRVRSDGGAMLLAMHDLDLAARYADRMIVMQAGMIAADGAPRDVLAGKVMQQVFGISRGDAGWVPA